MHHTESSAATASRWRLAARLSMLLLAGALMVGVACSDSDSDSVTLTDPDATGAQLANRYLELLQEKDIDGLRSFLSDAFIIQRANGSHSEKAAYLENLPDIGPFTITDVNARQAGNSLIVRWFLTVEEVINGEEYNTEPAPRLSTFVYTDGDWRLASHANFNAPSNGGAAPPASPTSGN